MTLVKVKVFPGSKTESLTRKNRDSYVLKVRERAEGGAANHKVRQMLALYFKIPEGRLRLVKGGKQPNKIFDIPD